MHDFLPDWHGQPFTSFTAKVTCRCNATQVYVVCDQALSAALEDFPTVNSSLHSKGDALLQHSLHNIGIAMATPTGLVVPNIKDVQKCNVASIAAELTRLQRDATLGRVNQSDLTGGTISMSNIGKRLFVQVKISPVHKITTATCCKQRQQLKCCFSGHSDNMYAGNVTLASPCITVTMTVLLQVCSMSAGAKESVLPVNVLLYDAGNKLPLPAVCSHACISISSSPSPLVLPFDKVDCCTCRHHWWDICNASGQLTRGCHRCSGQVTVSAKVCARWRSRKGSCDEHQLGSRS